MPRPRRRIRRGTPGGLRWRPTILVVAALAVLGAAGAGGAPVNAYTATATPTVVLPSSARVFTIRLTNDAESPDRAQRARIGIPAGFSVAAASVTATTSPAGICGAVTWGPDGTLIAEGGINLKKPGGGQSSELCPGATLTVTFNAAAPAADLVGAWETELLRSTGFSLIETQPTVRVDGTPPATTIDSGPPAATNSRSATLSFSADETGTGFECGLDGAPLTSCTSPVSYTALTDGTHTFRVRATDLAGNTDPTAAQRTWVVDTSEPGTSIVSGPPDPTSSQGAAFTLGSTEPGSAFQCKLDGASFVACTNPTSYAALTEGQHTFQARAVDPAGNVDSTSAVHSWRIDRTPPQTTIADRPADPTNAAAATFTFSSGEGSSSFECRLDGAPFQACASPTSYAGLPDGRHTFDVRARDAAGNTDATPATHAWTIDTVAPDTQIDSSPFDPSNVPDASFAFSSSEGDVAFDCGIDGGSFTSCTSPESYGSLVDGEHTFAVRAKDAAGNVGPVARHTWTIGTAAPLATIAEHPADPSNGTTATFAFSTSPTGGTFQCRLDDEAFAPCTSPATYGPLADGRHRFVVQATAADQTGSPVGFAWTIDTVTPVAAIDAAPPTLTNASTAAFAFSTNEPFARFECRLDGGAFAECESPLSYAGLPHGAHTFSVRAFDRAGNVSTPVDHTWTVDLVAPQTTIGAAPPARTKSTFSTFEFASSEAGSTFECRIDGGAFTTCTSPRSYGSLSDGMHVFDVRATDPAGNLDTSPASHSFTVDTVPPQTTIGSKPVDPTNSGDAAFAFASDEAGSSFACRLDGGASVACTPPQAYADLADGQHTFVVQAIDAAGNGDPTPAGYVWRVDTAPPDTAITSGPSGLTNSSSPAFAFTSTEADSMFECRLDASPFAPCSSPALYTGLVDGMHTFEVRARDTAGNGDLSAASRTWKIDTAAPDTAIASRPSAQANSRDVTFSFSSEADATFECSLDGSEFSSCVSPRLYSGLSEGPHGFEVRAIDAAGNQDATPAQAGWVVDVTAPDTSFGPGPVDPTNSRDAILSFSSEAGATFECRLDSAAYGPCSSPATLANLSEGRHTFEARAADAAGNVDGSPASRSWTVDVTAPQTAITAGPPDPSDSGLASFTFGSSEPGSSFECKVDAGGYGACASPASFLLGDGAHTFAVRAKDAAGNTDATAAMHAWRIDTAEPDTTLTSAPSGSVSTRTATLAFTSPDAGVRFECRLDAVPFAPCTSPAEYSNLAEGSHMFEVRAVDPANNADLTPAAAVWTVDVTPPDTSILSSPADPTNSRDASVSFSSSDPGATFDCKLDTGSFVACTSPKLYTGLSEAPHTVEVRARDAAGNLDATPATRSWTVDVTPPATSIDSGPSGSTNQTTATFGFSSNTSAATFECKLDNLPFGPCSTPRSYSLLSDGQHTFAVQARDAAGNLDATPATRTWTIDTAAPEPGIDTPLDGSVTNDTTPALAGMAGIAAGDEPTITIRVYAGPDPNGTPLQVVSVARNNARWSGAAAPLAEGVYTGRAEQRDAAGNLGLSSTTIFTVDTSGPGASITEKPPNPSTLRIATFAFASTDAAASYRCRLDAGEFAPCASPHTYTGLADGPHTFSVNASDAASNTGGNSTYSWTIDATPPVATINTAASALTKERSAAFTFGANEPGSRFQCGLDGAAFTPCTSPMPYSGLSEGSHVFNVRAVDTAGNVGAPASRLWTVDATAPDTIVTAGPPATVETGDAFFAFTSTEEGSFECAVDGAPFAACTSPRAISGIVDGLHSFAVGATDRAGNVDPTPALHVWTVARPTPKGPETEPAAPDVAAPAEVGALRVRSANASVTLTWTLPRDADLDHVSVVRIDSGKAARRATVYHGVGTTFTDRAVKNGVRYRYRIATHDRTGNGSAGVEVSIVPSGPLVAPVNGARVTAPPLLRWQPTPRATYYNVQLWTVRRGKLGKILSAWPVMPRFQLPSRWTYEGKAYRLVPGRYVWFVFPAFGKRAAERYGKLLGESTFTVAAKKTAAR